MTHGEYEALKVAVEALDKKVDGLRALFFWFGGMVMMALITTVGAGFTIYRIHETKDMHHGAKLEITKMQSKVDEHIRWHK